MSATTTDPNMDPPAPPGPGPSPRALLAAAWNELQEQARTDPAASAPAPPDQPAPAPADAPADAAAAPLSPFASGQSQESAETPEAEAPPPAADEEEDPAPAAPVHPAEGRSEPVELTKEAIVEAILFATDLPLPAAKIAELAELDGASAVKRLVGVLNDRYRAANAAFRVESLAGGYQLLSLPHFNPWLSQLRASRQETRLTPSALETLALVAYKQPVTRAAVEAIRGVASGEVLRTLMERGLVKMAGRAEEPGRPMLYSTTKKFLRVFGLSSVRDLPNPEKKDKTPPPQPPAPENQ